MSAFDEDTVELNLTKRFAEFFFATPEAPLQLKFAAASHQGKVRSRNEDHYAIIRSMRSREIIDSNVSPHGLELKKEHAHGMVVTDGIGGASGGDVASELVIRTLFELAGRATSSVLRITDLDEQQVRERVDAYVSEMQSMLRMYSHLNPALEGMGTTWTSAHLLGADVIVVHIGDSRAYLFRQSKLEQLTHDQTVGQEMADAGAPEGSAKRFRNVLTNSLGTDSEFVEAEINHLRVQPGDRLLLCTDGLSDMVSNAQISDTLSNVNSSEAAVQQLLDQALDAGGRDNVTLVLCDVAASE